MTENNQIWSPYLTILQQGSSLSALHYTVKHTRVSPYLEMQTDSLHGNGTYQNGQARLEVNPYVRFFPIFDPLLTSENLGYEQFEQALSDVMLHCLADLDIKMGMSRHDFYIRLLMRDLEQGTFGGDKELAEFSIMERRMAAEWLLSFYHTADASASLAGAVHAVLPDCEIYIREGEEFVFYMRQPFAEPEEKKLRFLIWLFLPLSCSCTIHWTKTYGVIGYEDTMRMEGFVLA